MHVKHRFFATIFCSASNLRLCCKTLGVNAAHGHNCPTNVGQLSDTSGVSRRYFEIKLSLYVVSIRSDPYHSQLGMGEDRYMDATSAILVG